MVTAALRKQADLAWQLLPGSAKHSEAAEHADRALARREAALTRLRVPLPRRRAQQAVAWGKSRLLLSLLTLLPWF